MVVFVALEILVQQHFQFIAPVIFFFANAPVIFSFHSLQCCMKNQWNEFRIKKKLPAVRRPVQFFKLRVFKQDL
jgi:hypothetical protein